MHIENLKGRIALVTGAGQGMGRAVAEALSERGATVVINDVSAEAAQKVALDLNASGGTAIAVPADVSRGADVRRMVAQVVERFGAIHVLVNNAGVLRPTVVPEISEEEWDFILGVNLKGTFLCSQAVLPAMKEKGYGRIVCFSSVGAMSGSPSHSHYAAAKAAVIGLTKAIAADYVKQGIRCNCIGPGTVDTPSLHDRINAFADPVQARKDFIARQPMGRLGAPEDITGIVVFLASDESKFATGNMYSVDGGMTI